jgi:hypothetical protein
VRFVRLVSNLREKKGLWRDSALLMDLLLGWGYEVEALDFREEPRDRIPDLVICLEVAPPEHMVGRRRWLIPNPEWWEGRGIDRFDKVLCKTRSATRSFEALGAAAEFVGFFSEDRHDGGIPRERKFLHNPGGSTAKGTDAIVDAWQRYRVQHPLAVVGWEVAQHPVRQVRWCGRLSDADHRREQNAAVWHLCPSETEGWGHSIHEALSVGAVVVVPDAPPFDEWHAAVRVTAQPMGSTRQAMRYSVEAKDMRAAIERCAAMSDEDLATERVAARAAYLAERKDFEERFKACLTTP